MKNQEDFMTGLTSCFQYLPKSVFTATLILVYLFMTAGLVHAEGEDASARMTIMEAIRIALADNHELKAMKNAALAQEKDIGIARSLFLPRIFIEERYLQTTNPGYAFMSRLNQARIVQQDFNPSSLNHPDPISDFQSSLTLEQPLFMKKALVGLDISKTEAQARNAELGRRREDVAYQVVRACLTIVSAREFLRAADQGVEDAREHHRVALTRFSNGVGQYADTLRTSTALTDARQKRNVAEKNLHLARRGLGLLLGMTGAADVEDATLPLHRKELPYYVNAAVARSDLQAAELRVKNASNSVRMAEAGYFPYIGAAGTYQLHDHNHPFGSEGSNWQVGAFLRWDLFDGTRREYERSKSMQLSSQAREQVAALKKGIDYRIYEAYLNVEEAVKNVDLARESLQAAREGTRLIKARYENGLSPLTELLNAQTSLEQARTGMAAQESASKIALATLCHESGTILQDLNIE